MNAQPEWHDLQVFLAIARGGGLSGASRELGVHHATVSRRLARLEDQLGTTLFTRRQHGLSLTASGEDLLQHVETIEAEVHAIGRKVAGQDRRLQGRVRVTTVDDFALMMMPDLLVAFRAQYPGIEVELLVQTDRVSLDRRTAEIALRFGQPPEDGRTTIRKVARVASSMYGSREYLDRYGTPRTPEDLAGHTVVRGDIRFARLAMETFLDAHVPPERVALRSNVMLARLGAIRAGLGIGVLATFTAAHFPELVRLEVPHPDMGGDLWMVVHQDLRENARVRAFADFAWGWLVARRPILSPP